MNTDKLVPIAFSRKITPFVAGDTYLDDRFNEEFTATAGFLIELNNQTFSFPNLFVVSYADRPNTGKQPVDDDVRVDADFDDSLYYNANASEVTWSEDDEASTSHETWKPNHDAMVERYQASLAKEWPTKEQQENINPGIKPELAASMVAPVGKVESGLIVSKQELSAFQTLKSFGYKHENGVWSRQEVKPAANTINAATALYVFAGWLTSLKEPITFSRSHWATPAADMAAEIIKINGLDGVVDFDNAKTPSDSVITVCEDIIKPELAAYMNPHVTGQKFVVAPVGDGVKKGEIAHNNGELKLVRVSDSSIELLGVFLRKNELVKEGEGVIDCVIRELSEKHDIDTRTDEEKLRDALSNIGLCDHTHINDDVIFLLLNSKEITITLKGK